MVSKPQWNELQKTKLWLKVKYKFIFSFCELCFPVLNPEQLLFEDKNISISFFIKISSLEMHKHRTDSLDERWLSCEVFVLSPSKGRIAKQRTRRVPSSLHIAVYQLHLQFRNSADCKEEISLMVFSDGVDTLFLPVRLNAELGIPCYTNVLNMTQNTRHFRRKTSLCVSRWRDLVIISIHFWFGWRCNLNEDLHLHE